MAAVSVSNIIPSQNKRLKISLFSALSRFRDLTPDGVWALSARGCKFGRDDVLSIFERRRRARWMLVILCRKLNSWRIAVSKNKGAQSLSNKPCSSSTFRGPASYVGSGLVLPLLDRADQESSKLICSSIRRGRCIKEKIIFPNTTFKDGSPAEASKAWRAWFQRFSRQKCSVGGNPLPLRFSMATDGSVSNTGLWVHTDGNCQHT